MNFSNVLSAHVTSGNSLVQNNVKSVVDITHSPHTGDNRLLLGQPVIYVIDVEGAGPTAQTLNECREVEVLKTRSS